mmetsp:Transcript_54249/g.131624  ORF Transcript_54249/g.131624 Transcript_54249/m.131624 type:complete len:545 (+) Transcript_54249:103-1737(+)
MTRPYTFAVVFAATASAFVSISGTTTTIICVAATTTSTSSTATTAGRFRFGGESFLEYELPNYDDREQQLSSMIVSTVIVSILFMIVLMISVSNTGSNVSTSRSSNINNGNNKQRRKVYKVQIVNGKEVLVPLIPVEKNEKVTSGEESKGDSKGSSISSSAIGNIGLPWLVAAVIMGLVVGLVGSFYVVLTSSPQNVDVARGIFEAPFLTDTEVHEWMNIGANVAGRNMEKVQQQQQQSQGSGSDGTALTTKALYDELNTPPFGWRKQRQPEYPLTDLQVEDDPFFDDELDWIQDKLDKRLSPLIHRVYNIPPVALTAPGQLLVRYEPSVRTSLERHTDNQDLSYLVLLSTNFTGGGTRYWSRMNKNEPIAHIQPTRAGQIILTNGLIDHEGVAVESGTRFIVVGFLTVDHTDRVGLSTHTSIFSTWLSTNWLTRHLIMFLEDVVTYSQGGTISQKRLNLVKYLPNLFLTETGLTWIESVINFFTYLTDSNAPHFYSKLVSDQNVDTYLNVTPTRKTLPQWGHGSGLPRSTGTPYPPHSPNAMS